ncbi:glycosyltransferase [Paractinoplanes rishiriensis]|uniref:Glycosyltransferase n=1 Tax=Paractinoplanes rishiriensis TaxID=1050105 RepID=A0A919N241_9ACTN|nr:glycosyltransferase [Actinoplanes rishiriensis]GIE98557.1 hypothetical protein Ari01nite_60220 [Actinoplanes rishiriensis]
MRIAHFCDSHEGRPDGVSRSAALTVSLLRAAGHEVDLVHPGPLLTRSAEAGRVRSIPVPRRQVRVALPSPRPPLTGPPLTGPPDVIHAHTVGPIGMTGFRLAERWRVPLVMTWHTDLLAYADHFPEIPTGAAWCARQLRLGWSAAEFLELTRPGAVRRHRLAALGQAMFARLAVAIAPSPKTAAGFADFAPLPPVCVLPTPVLPVVTVPLARLKRPGAVVLSVGRASAEKNPELLLQAFTHLRRTVPDARLVMLGVRQARAALCRRIAELDLAASVEMLPPVPPGEVTAYYRAADVLAFSSTTDTQSLVLAEAEATGLPVVAADPQLAERPGGGPPRPTCPPEPAAFAAALHRMLTDATLRAEVIDAGLAATAAYPPELFLSRLVEVYARSRTAELPA